ncbi:MAG: hypothetical protein QOE61_112 [Micromonosporaceae bacterium]|nr:hypothetical protein [Micromonosporaceae bacterium]
MAQSSARPCASHGLSTLSLTVGPALRQTPERAQVHHVAKFAAAALKPGGDALLPTEQALVGAGVDDVVPHTSRGHQEMRHLLARWWRISVDHPGERGPAARASRRDEHRGLIAQKMHKRERVPRAATPPEGLATHDREPQWHGGEWVRHYDSVITIKNDVALLVQLAQHAVSKRAGLRRPARLRERAIDGKPNILDVHAASLPRRRLPLRRFNPHSRWPWSAGIGLTADDRLRRGWRRRLRGNADTHPRGRASLLRARPTAPRAHLLFIAAVDP